jgi:nitroreductase
MDALTAIKTRRSIRKWRPNPVPLELVEELIEAAMYAPSAGDEQPWHFVIITDREVLQRVPDINPYGRIATNAPLGVLVCGDTRLEKYQGCWPQDCAAAIQNFLLAAHASGLGAVWTGIYPMQDRVKGFQKLCGLPKQVIPVALLLLGYPDQNPAQPQRFKKERVHLNKFNGKES